jgi:Zn-dependent peptidase ImmA (M78 family)
LAVKHLELKKLPKIKLLGDVETDHMPSFGKFSNDDRTVHLGIKNRHPNDILRTLAHEMVHYAQGEHGQLEADSGATGSPEEDQANAEAGVIMREFNQQFPQYMELKPIMLEKWSKKYKKSINCSNPKGFSQRAHCAGRKKANENFADGKGPGRPGDSQRHGIPKGATIAQLEKAAKAPGRKGQLARWQINMRRGKKK